MNGRLEKEKDFERKCSNMLKSMPKIANMFYVYFKASDSKRTNVSCHVYLNGIRTYFKYLILNGIDPDNIDYYTNVKPADITMFIDYYRNSGNKKKCDSSVALIVNVVKAFYLFLEDNGYIAKNPCTKIKPPKNDIRVKPTVMTKEEVNKVKDYILYEEKTFYNNNIDEEYWRLRDYLIFILGCRTGLRCSAISSINLNDIDFTNNCIIVVEKGNVKRNVYFGDNTKEILKKWIIARNYILNGNSLDALFISRKRNRISNQAIISMIEKYTSEVIPNKHITPHKMRSTCATNLWNETHDIYMVANQLSHKSLANTKRYTDISESESKRVANILDEL